MTYFDCPMCGTRSESRITQDLERAQNFSRNAALRHAAYWIRMLEEPDKVELCIDCQLRQRNDSKE